jgi:hypothetical protein
MRFGKRRESTPDVLTDSGVRHDGPPTIRLADTGLNGNTT